MATPAPHHCLISIFMLCIFAFPVSSSMDSFHHQSVVVGKSKKSVVVIPLLSVVDSPGTQPGSSVLCTRVHIHGLSRLRNLKKFSHSLILTLKYTRWGLHGGPIWLPRVEVCFHRNNSLAMGMCSQGEWKKFDKNSGFPMNPFAQKIMMDVRVAGSILQPLELSIKEEFVLYRVIFLVMGIVMLSVASTLSKSLPFYYTISMTIGIILVILVVPFQLGILLLVFGVLVGAWMGFWVARKLVLTEDGSVDASTSLFVTGYIWFFAVCLIVQSSMDPLLAIESAILGIMLSFISNEFFRFIVWRRLLRRFLSLFGNSQEAPGPSLKDFFLSAFYGNPERRKIFKEAWEKFTRDSTKKAVKELTSSSPEFSKWVGANADRIATIAPKDTNSANGSFGLMGTSNPSEEVKRLLGGKIKKKERQEVIIEKMTLIKQKCITTVKGLELFGVKLSDASKKLEKKFATGASVVKGPTEKEQIDVQGDIFYDIVDFITDTWPDVPESAIYFIEDGKKVPAAYFLNHEYTGDTN